MITVQEARVIHGDSIGVMRRMPEASVDAIVTDPPYGLEFMGKDWDGADGFRRSLNPNDAGRDSAFGRMSRKAPEYRAGVAFQEFSEAWARECLRVLKPGGHLLAFGGTRTWHRLAVAVEDAGFEIRDSIAWMYGSGFPKSLDVSKAIDKAAGAEREVKRLPSAASAYSANAGAYAKNPTEREQMWGDDAGNSWRRGGAGEYRQPTGRWPANVVLDEDQAAALDAQSGALKSGNRAAGKYAGLGYNGSESADFPAVKGDQGGASRFFYCAKAPKNERPVVDGVAHPTVKPLSLMRWLVRLVTPPGGTVLDPFAGSGTTIEAAMLEGFSVIGVEREAEYLPLIGARIARATKVPGVAL